MVVATIKSVKTFFKDLLRKENKNLIVPLIEEVSEIPEAPQIRELK